MFKSHPIMPNFAFTNEQAEDLAAYLKSLARRRVGFQPDACDPSKASLLDVHQTCFGKGRLSSFGM